MKAITKQWLDFAEAELRCCENNLHDQFVTSIVAFTPIRLLRKRLKP
jgi:hypothetical protein